MSRRGRLAIGGLLGCFALAGAGIPAVAVPAEQPPPSTATGSPELAIPAPRGPHPVGRDILHLIDHTRADPWVPTRRRELMVSLWYPARRAVGAPAPYLTPDESRLLLRRQEVPLPDDALSRVRTHARVHAPALNRGRSPLVVLSPGFSFPRATLTGLAEELASRGYIVVGVDHTYEAAGVSFPDGRVTDCLACDQKADPIAMSTGRARDVSFVLDHLLARHSLWPNARAIDRTRIAMIGHSIGGAAALSTMLTDRRVDAGVNLDGTFRPALQRPLHRPFLMLGDDDGTPALQDRTWHDTWAQLSGWKRWLTVTGSTHSSFTDLAVLADQIGMPLQTVPGRRMDRITRAYLVAFVDRHLRGRPEPLLQQPSSRFPEVRFWSP